MMNIPECLLTKTGHDTFRSCPSETRYGNREIFGHNPLSGQQGGNNTASGGCAIGNSGSTDLSAVMFGGAMLAGLGLLMVRRRNGYLDSAGRFVGFGEAPSETLVLLLELPVSGFGLLPAGDGRLRPRVPPFQSAVLPSDEQVQGWAVSL